MNKEIIGWAILGILGFIVVLSPFLLYETQHNFADFQSLLQTVLHSQKAVSVPPFRERVVDFSYRLFKYAIPLKELWQFPLIIISELLVIIIPFIRTKNKWHAIFSLWFIGGLFFISLYKGITFNHYLNFLLPIPFFLLGSFISSIKSSLNKNVLTFLCLLLLILQLKTLNLGESGNQDLQRVPKIANEMIIQAGSSLFSFTLLSSESFSDLHYRYFLLLNKKTPVKITNNNYQTLFLICEREPCPTNDEVKNMREVQTFCFDEHCRGNYSEVSLRDWNFISSKQLYNGILVTFKRNKS